MLIKMVSGVSGPRYSYSPGQEVDHPDEHEARRWIARGIAKKAEPKVVTAPQPEKAVVIPGAEAAVTRSRRRGARTVAH